MIRATVIPPPFTGDRQPPLSYMHQHHANLVRPQVRLVGLGFLLLTLGWLAALPAAAGDSGSDEGMISNILSTFGGWVHMGRDSATYDYYEALEHDAPEPIDKARAALAMAEVRWQAGKWWKAHEAYQHVATNYASLVPFDEVMEREFTIAKDHFEGNKGRFLFFHFSSNDKAIKIYDAILKVGPYSGVGARALYRSALLAVQEKDYEDAANRFHRLLTSYPESALSADARADLAQTLLTQAKDFDGDGTLAHEARGELDRFVARYPNHPRRAEVDTNRLAAQEIEASRLLFLGKFYQRPFHWQPAAAQRYLEDCITQFPRTESAREAAEQLAAMGRPLPAGTVLPPPVNLDSDYEAGGPGAPGSPAAVPKPKRYLDRADLKDKWLLPLEDLNPPQEQP
jgi:tetratricopeptide (TPR) repeat protein